MSDDNVFTEQELKELGQPRNELIQASIDAGDPEKAIDQTNASGILVDA